MGIGRELVEQTGGTLHAFCGAVGTGGMLAGVSKALKAAGCADTAAGSRAAHGIGRCDAFKVHDELVVGDAGTFRRVAIPAAELDRR